MHDRDEGRRINIAYLTTNDATDPRSWSGTPHFILRTLERHVGDVNHVGPMPSWPKRLMRLGAKVRESLGGRRSLPGHEEFVSAWYGQVAERRLIQIGPRPDVIFSPAGSVLLARLRADLPIVYSSDATVRVMLDYYPQFTGLSDRAIRMADDLERAAIARADLLLYPTHWAADSAVADYDANPAKVQVLPYGANLSIEPKPPMQDAVVADPERPCRLLMVGVDWAIKGGAIAVEALRALQARKIPATLTVVGCGPPERINLPGLVFIPFLDKNNAEDLERLDALYRQADFFILPSRCECFGIVFCEAAAYGLPSLATRTGGIPEVVLEGQNGYTLPPGEGGEAYAARIAEIWSDLPRYRALRASSRWAFETRLNWDIWGEAAARLIRDTIITRATRSTLERAG